MINQLRHTCLLLLCFSVVSAKAQTVKVLDHFGKSLAYAHISYNVIGDSTPKGILTDLDGLAQIPNYNQNNVQLAISHLGYETIYDTLIHSDSKIYRMKQIYLSLNQMVVTAQYRTLYSSESVHSIRVIDQLTIESQAAVSLKDVLKFENNIRISQDNILGSGMSMQGISGQNVKILKDGVPIIGRLNGNIDLSQINLDDIERIELVEGPLSVNYGTDALAGTINLISKKNKGNHSFLNSYYESVGQYNINFGAGIVKNKNSFNLSGGRNFFDGWSSSDNFTILPKPMLADSNRFKQWKPKEQFFSKFIYDKNLDNLDLKIFGEHFSEKITNRGYPRLPYFENAFDDFYYTWRNDFGVDLQTSVKKDQKLNVIIAYNDFRRIKNTYLKDLTNLQMELSKSDSDQDTTKFNMWMSRGVFSSSIDSLNFAYEIGYDIRQENAFGKRIESGFKTQGDYAVFASSELNFIKNFLLRPGIRYSYNTVYKSPVVPSINLKYSFPLDLSNWSSDLRLSYARGFRAPTLKELYFEFVDVNHNIVGNEQLKSEQSDNFNFDFKIQRIEDKYMNQLKFGAFYIGLYDMISLAQVDNTTQYSYINVGKYESFGVRASNEISRENLKMACGYSYIGRKNEIASVSSYNFVYSSELNARLNYTIDKVDTRFNIYYKYTGEMPIVTINENGDLSEGKVDDYHMLDITLQRLLWKNKINISMGAKNILNVQNILSAGSVSNVHSENSSTMPVSWGRTYFISLKLNFDW